MQHKVACKVCAGMEPFTVDRLLVIGYGPRFVARRWGFTRQAVARHRDRCLVGQRRADVEADIARMAGEGGE